METPRSVVRLHRGGRWRAWLGARLGGDAELGDRIWRRCLHAIGAAVLAYYLLPPRLLVVLTNAEALLLALGIVLLLEVARWTAGLELPTIRPHEEGRPASFSYFAVALVIAVLVFPEPIAVAVVLGSALIDPLLGELRIRRIGPPVHPLLPLAAYFALAAPSLYWIGGWSLGASAVLAALAAAIGIAVERPRLRYLDDDFTMAIVPGLVLTILVIAVPGLTTIGR